jgi:hypothetical protein
VAHGASSNLVRSISADMRAPTAASWWCARQQRHGFSTLGAGACSQCRNVGAGDICAGTPLSWATYFSSAQADGSVKNADQSTNIALNATSGVHGGLCVAVDRRIPGTPAVVSTCRTHGRDTAADSAARSQRNRTSLSLSGYANFRISRVDANDVWGYAISSCTSRMRTSIGLRPD